jgi:hypothetical protein
MKLSRYQFKGSFKYEGLPYTMTFRLAYEEVDALLDDEGTALSLLCGRLNLDVEKAELHGWKIVKMS